MSVQIENTPCLCEVIADNGRTYYALAYRRPTDNSLELVYLRGEEPVTEPTSVRRLSAEELMPEAVDQRKRELRVSLWISTHDKDPRFIAVRVHNPPAVPNNFYYTIEFPFGVFPFRRMPRRREAKLSARGWYRLLFFRRLHEWAYQTQTPITPEFRIPAKVTVHSEGAYLYALARELELLTDVDVWMMIRLRDRKVRVRNIILEELLRVLPRETVALFISYIPAVWAALRVRGQTFKPMWDEISPYLLHIAAWNSDFWIPPESLGLDPDYLERLERCFPKKSEIDLEKFAEHLSQITDTEISVDGAESPEDVVRRIPPECREKLGALVGVWRCCL